MARFSILTMMKDEGPFLLDWLAYHRLIGFDAIWVYSNDCRDGSDAMLDRLEGMGLVRHIRNEVPPGRAPQPHALTLGQKNTALLATDWLLVMDADEYLQVNAGRGTVAELISACPSGTDGIAVTWRMMGSNGHETWWPGPDLTSYTRGAPDDFRRGWGVKTLFRPFDHLKLGIHRPTVKRARRDASRMSAQHGLSWVNGSGRPLPPSFMAGGWRSSAATVGYDLAQLVHYATRSIEAYLMRGDRGNVNLKPDKYDATYFAVFDRNETDQQGLVRWAEPVAAQVQDWLCDPDLSRLNTAARDWHAARIADMRSDTGFAARRDALRQAAELPYDALDRLLFIQPLAPQGKRMVREMQVRGMDDASIARAVATSVGRLEAERDARDAAELRAMGVTPANGL